jgi:hypothetical protein
LTKKCLKNLVPILVSGTGTFCGGAGNDVAVQTLSGSHATGHVGSRKLPLTQYTSS